MANETTKKTFCWIFMLSVAIVSPMFLDLYPFSVFPMFSDNDSEYLILEITDSESNSLDPLNYGLLKIQLANRQQRYGFDLGPNYFDHHESIDPVLVESFLRKHFPDRPYPITITYRIRGFESSSSRIEDLSPPTSFLVDIKPDHPTYQTASVSSEATDSNRSNVSDSKTKLGAR